MKMDLQTLNDYQLEAVLSRRYLSAERVRSGRHSRNGVPVSADLYARFWKLLDDAVAEYSRRHTLNPKCWYGMKPKNGLPAKPGDVWVPWACGKITDLRLPHWVRVITAWTDLFGWRVIDLHEDHGMDYLKRAIRCWLHSGHRFSAYVQTGECLNNPFGGGPYSHCENCPACVQRVFDANGCEVRRDAVPEVRIT